MGEAETPSVVASRMRLVFSTLEVSNLHFVVTMIFRKFICITKVTKPYVYTLARYDNKLEFAVAGSESTVAKSIDNEIRSCLPFLNNPCRAVFHIGWLGLKYVSNVIIIKKNRKN